MTALGLFIAVAALIMGEVSRDIRNPWLMLTALVLLVLAAFLIGFDQ